MLFLDALLDHIGGDSDEFAPRTVRRALTPLRTLVGEENVAPFGSLHPRKGQVKTFRELVAASHQFNAISRSSMLLSQHPTAEDRRVLAVGKSNHAMRGNVLECRIEVVHFELNGRSFRDVRAVDWKPSEVDLEQAVAASTGAGERKVSKAERAEDIILELLEDRLPRLAKEVRVEVCKRLGCGTATVERAAQNLREDGLLGSRAPLIS